MSDAVVIALIGGAAGIVTAVTTGVIKIYELVKSSKSKSLEERIKPVIEEAIAPTNQRLDLMQVDVTRMRFLNLMRDDPTDAENILILGKRYFENMHGNSEASKQFARWLKEQHIKTPEWFKPILRNLELKKV